MIKGKCYCGAIRLKAVGKVTLTTVCHCKDCQIISGSVFVSTSLMVYNPRGVESGGDDPIVFRAASDQGNTVQGGFCGTCWPVLFNHVNKGKGDEHWAVRTVSVVDSRALRMEKKMSISSKPSWVPKVTKPDAHFIGMPKKEVEKDKQQKTIEETNHSTIGSQKKQKANKDDDGSGRKRAAVEDGKDDD